MESASLTGTEGIRMSATTCGSRHSYPRPTRSCRTRGIFSPCINTIFTLSCFKEFKTRQNSTVVRFHLESAEFMSEMQERCNGPGVHPQILDERVNNVKKTTKLFYTTNQVTYQRFLCTVRSSQMTL